MNLSLTDEQRLLRQVAADALAGLKTIAGARAALDGAPLHSIWPTASEAGWTGLLVPEPHGGAGAGVFDAMLVAEQCGRFVTGAGLLGHLTATLVLGAAAEAGDGHAAEVLPALAGGERRAALVAARPPTGDEGWTVDATGTEARRAPAPTLDADGLLIGIAGFALDVAGADLLVVPALTGATTAVRAVLVEPAADGVTVEPLVRCDASRPLAHLGFDGAPGRALAAGPDVLARAWYVAQALLAADALGVSQAMLDMAVGYAKQRYAFGRPIGSYQAVKQQIVEILRHTDATRSLCHYAGYAASERPEELPLAASAARVAGENAAEYATRTCIAVHGGIGATWEHDAHLYWRRAQLSRLLLGGIDDASDRVAEETLLRARS